MASLSDTVPDDHYRITYEEVHVHICNAARKIKQDFDPDVILAIAGGGLFPARVLRTFLKRPSRLDPTKLRNVPINVVSLALYEEIANSSAGALGREVLRTQWLDAKAIRGQKEGGAAEEGKGEGLLGKRILIVDEVDDSRTTLQYAYNELLKDVRKEIKSLSPQERAALPPTRFGIFVVNNKLRQKRGVLPIYPEGTSTENEPLDDAQDGDKVGKGCFYWAAETTGDVWIDYPWEQDDIIEHNRLAAVAKKLGINQPVGVLEAAASASA
ncbi:related to xpt1-xanthine phosphoribosyl transferase [Ceraceosorus bombacis]|uniref:Related to xpt1-xanthine phosphoribosyl transferase n=1 Tax=Ceraceosorus bombacis TaxID=401625 RepID=A0A0P1BHA1_9BASI|nr:related to xpt1-xanthine phosphoribosyl transferase [Ceraceosorus bombacis]